MKGFRRLGDPLFSAGLTRRNVLGSRKSGGAPSPQSFSDGFARADGVVGNNWTGSTWAISNGKLLNAPNIGATEHVTDGSVENWTTPTNLTNWTEIVTGSSSINQESDPAKVQDGSYSCRADIVSGAAGYFLQDVSAAANIWLHVDNWVRITDKTKSVNLRVEQGGAGSVFHFLAANDTFENIFTTLRTSGVFQGKQLRLQPGTLANGSVWWDKISAKALTESELHLTRPVYPTPDYILQVKISTMIEGTLAGIRFAADSISNPQNYLLAVTDGRTIYLRKVLGGTLTTVTSKAQVFAANDVLKVVKNGTSIKVYCNDVAIAATQTVSDAAIKDNLYAGIFSTYSGNQFDDWSETVRAAGGSDAFLLPFFSASQYIFPIGDSITVGATDEVNGTGYPIILCDLLSVATKAYWKELPLRDAAGGRTVAIERTLIDASLAARSDTPNYVLILFGTNELGLGLPAEATYKADYAYILDAIHAKWANAQIYCGVDYRMNSEAGVTTLMIWNADVIAGRDYCHVGIDGNMFSGHPEWYADAVPHLNHAGFVAMANGWKTAMGY